MRLKSALFLFFLLFGLMLPTIFGSSPAYASTYGYVPPYTYASYAPKCPKFNEDRTAVPCNADADDMASKHAEADKDVTKVECWQGKILASLYDLAANTTQSIYKKITQGALAFILTVFAVWAAFKILGHVSSFMEENPAELWTEITQKLFLCFACGLVASSPDTVLFALNLFVFPIYEALLELSSEILNTVQKSVAENAGELKIFGQEVSGWGQHPMQCKPTLSTAASTTIFPSGPKNMMGCMVCMLSQRLNLGFVVAFQTMKTGGLMPFVVGIFIFFSFLFVKLGFAFYLIDTIFKMAMMLVIFPLAILALPFKATRKWMKECFFQILNSAGYMLFITLFIAMAIMAIQKVVVDMNNAKLLERTETGFKELSVPIISLALLCFLLTSSTEIAQKVTTALVGGDSSANFQKKLAGVAKAVIDYMTGKIMTMMKKAKEMSKNQGDGAGNSLGGGDDKKEDKGGDAGGDSGGGDGGDEGK